MPTSTAAKPSTGVQRNGFTLVELLVAIALMAAASAVVVLTVGPSGRGAADIATRFASRLAAARDEAILTGRPMSAWASASGYGFDQLRAGYWKRLSDKPFRGDDWGEGTQVALDTPDARARVRFDTLGMPDQPMVLRIARDGRIAQVRLAANGDVTVQ